MRRLSWLGWPLIGLVTGLGFAPWNVWPYTILGLALFTWRIRAGADAARRPLWRGLGRGWLMGLGLWWLLVGWIDVLGWYVALALVPFMALWGGLAGVVTTLTRRLPLWPVWAALSWTLVEWASSRVPFGGFGWMRLAYVTADAPMGGYLPWIGVAGTSLVVAFLAALLAGGFEAAAAVGGKRWWRPLLRPLATVVLLAGVGLPLGTMPPLEQGVPLQVGMVQGNVDGTAGSQAMGYARSVTNNHLSETIMLMAKARTGQVAMPDFVVWPENATDVDPLRDVETQMLVRQAVALTEVPIYVGAVMQGPGEGERQTSGLWWVPDQGVQGRYDKRNLVPFGEYIPMRSTLLPLLPVLQQVGAQSVPGVAPSVFEVEAGDQRFRIGDVICFELAWDSTVRQAATDDVNLLVVQSNNATYTGTGQPRQQFAITRVRAMETRREIVVSTTSSFSGHIDGRGRVLDRTEEATSASAVYRVHTQVGTTPATRLGPWLERAGVLAVVVACAVAMRRRRGHR